RSRSWKSNCQLRGILTPNPLLLANHHVFLSRSANPATENNTSSQRRGARLGQSCRKLARKRSGDRPHPSRMGEIEYTRTGHTARTYRKQQASARHELGGNWCRSGSSPFQRRALLG